MNSKINTINFFLFYPQHFIKIIRTDRNSAIDIIKNSLQKEYDYNYICKGNIIDPNKTFNEIELRNGELIVVTKKKSNELTNNDYKFLQITKKNDLERKILVLTNKKMRNEIFHLRDIRVFKQEGSSKLYRKLSRKLYLQQSKKDDDDQVFNDLEINYEPSATPCTDAMPILW